MNKITRNAAFFCVPLCLLLSLAEVSVFADSPLFGTWSKEQQAINNGLSSAFYLDGYVTNCSDLIMMLTINDYSGAPFGNWYLYAKDLNGNWEHIAEFKIEKNR